MFRNLFREPKPGTYEELVETFDELDLNPAECSAVIFDSRDEDAPYTGWTVEVTGTNSDGEDKTFDSAGWEDQNDLRNDLKAVGLFNVTLD